MWGQILQKNIPPTSSGFALHLLIRNVGKSTYQNHNILFPFALKYCIKRPHISSIIFLTPLLRPGTLAYIMCVTTESDILYLL
jgi:hypothetical protein